MLLNYLKDYFELGGAFDGPLLIKNVEICVANTGNQYFNITMQDISGSISARKWNVEIGDKELLVPGNIVRVVGTVFKYKSANQLKIEQVYKVDMSSIDMNDFYIHCPLKDKQLEEELSKMIDLITDDDLKKLVINVINENKEKYMSYPAAISVHHAYRGGIIYHSLSIAKAAVEIANLYPQLDKNYLISGALLHDIGKIVEMNGVNATSYTLRGNLEGHINIGAMIVNQIGEKIGTPEFKLAVIVHMILSHHGHPEYGSSVVPKTQEAYVLHILDDLDAKMYVLNASLNDLKVGEMSPKLPFMDGVSFLKTK